MLGENSSNSVRRDVDIENYDHQVQSFVFE